MNTLEKVTAARKILELPDRATLQEIKSNYKRLVSKWHPDKCQDDESRCHEMTQKLNSAYKTIMAYCEQYKFSFEEAEIRKYMTDEEWWFERFGQDPLWGK